MLWRSEWKRQRQLAEALSASLDAMRAGTASLEDCLRLYPQLADELQPLLQTSATVQVLGQLAPRDDARVAGRAAFLQAAARRTQPRPAAPVPIARRRPWVAFAPVGIAAALFAAIAVPVLGSMDTGSTPGDWNYGFKRATERIRLAVATDPSDRRLLRLEFAARRIDEAERLSATGHVVQKSDLTALFHDYTADLAQVTASAQSAGSLPADQKQQIANLTDKANDLANQVQQSVPATDPLNTAAQNAKNESTAAASLAKALPTPPTHASAPPPSPSAPSTAAVVVPTINPAPPTAVATPPQPAASLTPPAPGTPPGSATVGATGTPAATSTVSGSPITITVTATPPPTPSAVPTRVAPVLPSNLSTPLPAATSTPATVSPTRTPGASTPVSSTPSSAPRSPTPASEPTALAANPTRTPLPAALAPLSGSASPGPAAEPTPARAAAPLAPTPVGTRASTVLPPVTGSTALVAGTNVFKYAGAPAGLDQVTASLGGELVVVWYVNAQQTSSSWYPGTPPPLIEPGTILTIVTRGPAVLAAPGTLLSVGR